MGLWAASVILALPLALAGIYPRAIAALASMPDAIPADAGNLASVVAGPSVWITLGVPLLLGIGVSVIRPRFWSYLGRYPDLLSRLASLEWLAEGGRRSVGLVSVLWERLFDMFEGAGYVAWATVFVLVAFFLFG